MKVHRSFRNIAPSDLADCVALFRSNVPSYFCDEELPEFEEFVSSAACPYFVIEIDDVVVGCGGYGLRDDSDVADLCWGMVASDHHGRGLGEYLLYIRLREIINREHVQYVRLCTSQHTSGFFERYGFVVQSRKRDGFAEGLDDLEMRLELNEDSRRSFARDFSERLSGGGA